MPRFKKLGSSDISVCEVCLGTMTFGTMTANEADAHAILDRYVELGGNFIDTAEMYPVPTDPAWMGASEEVIGRWLAKGGAELRAKVVIATKVSGPRAAARYAPKIREKTLTGSTTAAPAEPDFSRAQIRRACEASLKRLQTDYIDLYQLHWPERYVPKWGGAQYLAAGAAQDAHHHLAGFEAIVATMGELLSEGKIKTWGVSNETSYGTCMFVEASRRQGVAPPVSIQNDFSLCYRTYETELAETCAPAHHNLSLLAYGVLNGGALTGKYLDGTAEPNARFNFAPKFQPRYRGLAAAAATREYVAIAKEAGVSPAVLAQAWAYSRHYMGAVIIGATSIAQLESNWAAADVQLGEDLLKKIDDVHIRRRNPNCDD